MRGVILSALGLSCGVCAETIVVTDNTDQAELEKSALTDTLATVPGGTNLIDLDGLHAQQPSLAKALAYQPGIVVQEFFGGNDQPRINIRGSGIQDNPVNRGIQLLYDGLPLNQADGSFIIGLLDPEQAKFISVYRGANAMRYGATTLGGAINLHARHGANSPDSGVKLSGGSFGLVKGGLNLSEQVGAWDTHLNLGHYQQEGFRHHSQAQRNNLAFNAQIGEGTWQNTWYLNLADNRFNIPFLLTKEQAIANPSSVMGEGNTPMDTLLNIPLRQPFRHSKQVRVANKTTYYGDVFTHSLGVYGEWVDDVFRNPVSQSVTDNRNVGLDYHVEHEYINGLDLATDTVVFVSANAGKMPRAFNAVNPIDGSLMAEFAKVDQRASNLVLGAQVTQQLSDDWQALLSAQWVHNQRELRDEKNAGVLDSEFEYSVVNPKAGIIYTHDDQRYFANLSASSEAPNFWQLATVEANPNAPLNTYLSVNDLSMQTATTFEIGTQQRHDHFNVELAYYYSVVNDELISVVGDFAVNGKTINYQGKTVHQGIEFGVNHLLDALWHSGDYLSSKLIYNYSDFRFRDGEYGGKHIAGVPAHLIQGELAYSPAQAWRVATSVHWQPQDTWVDHLNSESVKQDPYLLIDLKTVYQYNAQLTWFLELNNLTNETYQTAYVIRGQSAPDLPTFIPGAGVNFAAGVTYNW